MAAGPPGQLKELTCKPNFMRGSVVDRYDCAMSSGSIGLSDEVNAYLERVGVREPEVLGHLREKTALMPEAQMQIAVEEGALLGMLVKLLGARQILEVGTFTGYSSTAMALALAPDGRMVCCDVSKEYTDVARQAWAEAGVADRVELRLGPAIQTLDAMLGGGAAGTFDLAFVDADKPNYAGYYERCLQLVRPGGLIAIDNVLWSGRVADDTDQEESTLAIRALNVAIAADERVDLAMVPIADGLTLARVR
jgi:predicted O-methyltransferase YrrM